MSSSIADAFQKALSKTQAHLSPLPAEWDDEGDAAKIETTTTKPTEQPTMTTERKYFQTTNNVTRTTFEYVRDNPGMTRAAAAQALSLQGFKKSSTTSILGQMVKQGLIRESNGGMYTAVPEYKPLKTSARFYKDVVKKTPPQPVTKKAVALPVNRSPQDDFSAEKIVERLTPKQAKAVYDYLRELFA